ncbi:type II toxin-antitoxin system HigB family toxin [Vibrio sp. 2304]|uniref:type II toxin-antitoxin system HigB family toxin n=1 Tax=Vibrio sp. 2304 TaxID=3074601 RepID=UPI00296552F5|nr:type II toxin-antitoxin system HigB family toxin [Vibrio sp. 2304]MDW2001547.1 type II toxin-antitoxin system HigB family toxin [Vibrio sp. 2304]
MKVLGRDKLVKFYKKHANAKSALEAWFAEAEKAAWKTPQDIKNRYGSADFLADNKVIFNIKGNHYRLVVKVRYQNGIAVVEWVGTHAQYDKQDF